jgi:hypothetical protein
VAVKNSLKTLIVAGAVGAAVMTSGIALAYGEATHGSDKAVATFFPAFDEIYADDGEADNHGVMADWYQNNGLRIQMWDGNGSQSGHQVWQTPWTIGNFRVCEDNDADAYLGPDDPGDSCSGWHG